MTAPATAHDYCSLRDTKMSIAALLNLPTGCTIRSAEMRPDQFGFRQPCVLVSWNEHGGMIRRRAWFAVADGEFCGDAD